MKTSAHGAYRKGTDEYRMPSAVVRGEHVCPECGQGVLVRRNTSAFAWAHRSPSECLYYAPESECPDEFERNHVIRVITKQYRAGEYVPSVPVESSSLPCDASAETEEVLREHQIPNTTADPTDKIVFNYKHNDSSFVFDVAVVSADGEFKTGTKIYPDASDTPRDVPGDLEWVGYSSASL